MRYCKNCGLLAPAGAQTCPQCGAALPPEPARPTGPAQAGPRYENDASPKPATVEALSEWATFGALLLFSVPVVGFIVSLAWSLGFAKNPARRRLAQAYLLRTLAVTFVVTLILLWLGLSTVLTLSVVRGPAF